MDNNTNIQDKQVQEDESVKNSSNPYLIPLSIVLAGALIAFAVFLSGGVSTSSGGNSGGQANVSDGSSQNSEEEEVELRPVTDEDHIRGAEDAPVKIVEFSDYDCPFCQRFHPTVKRALDEYEGDVAWVYRHFPLDTHPTAKDKAIAAECVASVAGNDAFWEYTDALFDNQDAGVDQLASLAGSIGADSAEVQNCLDNREFTEEVDEDFQDAINSGGRGTPHTIVIAPNGKQFPIEGAQPFSSLKATIDLALEEK